MSDTHPSITAANENTLCEFVRRAEFRLLILAPALSTKLAQTVCEQWRKLGSENVNVILDLDPEVFRLGYGDLQGMKLLEAAASELETLIQRQPGIRIGLVISDNTTLIFSPTPALIEAGPISSQAPNAVILDTTPPAVARELGVGENGTKDQTIGLDKATKADVAKVEEDLKQNPPQKFDIARTVRVFNAFFEFVDFKMTGTHIDLKTISIPPELMGLAKDDQTRRRLKANFRIVDGSDALSGRRLHDAKAWLVKTYLATLPGYGNVILRSVKPDFETKVVQLRRCIELFKLSIKKRLQKAMDENRKTLVEALLPSVLNSPPAHWRKYGAKPDTALVRKLLEDELERASGSAESLVTDMKVKVVFKGVTYELLTDAKFLDVARKALPSVPQLHAEFEAAKALEKEKEPNLFDPGPSA